MAVEFNFDSVKEFFENIINYFKNLETINLVAWIMILIGIVLLIVAAFLW